TFRLSGSGDGISDLVDGKCDIAMLSRPLKLSEYRAAVAMGVLPCLHTIEMDALAVIVHPGNPIKGLTREQIRDIYTGKITNWKQVGGHDLVIVPVSKDSSSGSCETFHRLVMNARKMSAVVETTPRSPQMHGRLKDTSGAIGYVGLGFLDKSVKALAVDGVFPSRAAILDGSYPVTRPMYLLTDGMPRVGSPIWKLIHFRFGREGHDIIESKGFFPVTRYKPRQQGRCIERASCMACSPK
ncbi:MAG: phosphate ABC transporter substrate-binding protein, partial [Phycisphaerae bacterium]